MSEYQLMTEDQKDMGETGKGLSDEGNICPMFLNTAKGEYPLEFHKN